MTLFQNSTDWAKNRPETYKAGQVPDSCCVGGQVRFLVLPVFSPK